MPFPSLTRVTIRGYDDGGRCIRNRTRPICINDILRVIIYVRICRRSSIRAPPTKTLKNLPYSLQYRIDQAIHVSVVVPGKLVAQSVGHDHAHRGATVAQGGAQTEKCRTLHLVIGHGYAAEGKLGHPGIDVRHGRRQTQFSTLGSVKSAGGGGDALEKSLVKQLGKPGVRTYGVRLQSRRSPSRARYEFTCEGGFVLF